MKEEFITYKAQEEWAGGSVQHHMGKGPGKSGSRRSDGKSLAQGSCGFCGKDGVRQV